ncbi:MAG TPA: hypothetical protein VK169_20540 [Saprospiraceae bacterium]|nr:hypothetical protein [Saprospiraceae bacterium]
MKESGFSQLYTLLPALFFGSLITYFFLNDTSFALEQLPRIIYSQATKDGIDISARASLIYKIVLFGGIFTSVIWYLLNQLFPSKLDVKQDFIKKIAFLSFIGITTMYCHIAHIKSFESLGIISSVLVFYLIIAIFDRFRLMNFNQDSYGENWTEKVLLSSFLITYQLKFFGINATVLQLSFFLLFFVVLFLLTFLNIIANRNFRQTNYHFPILTICFLSFFNIILFEIYSYRFYTSPHYYYAIFYFCFVLVLCGLYYFLSKKSMIFAKLNNISTFYLLSFTTLFVILFSGLYTPFGVQITDTFELANPAVPHMRILKDGEIPLVDFMSSHMISEQFYGYIYHLFHGYEGNLDFHSYSFLYEFLFQLLVFLFLNRLFKNPILALVFVVFFPYARYFFGRDYFWSILGFYMLHELIIKQTVYTYLAWFFMTVLLICWRLDTGAAFLMASPIFIGLALITSNQKIHFSPLLKALAIFISVSGLLVLIAIQLRSSTYLWDNFNNALSYVTSNQAHGTSSQSNLYNHLFYVVHLLLPFIAFVSIFTNVFILKKTDRKEDAHKYRLLLCSLFFYLIFLANFQRGVVRHNFLMEYDHMLTSTFYLAFILQMIAYSSKYLSTEFRFYAMFGGGFLIVLMVKVFHLSAKIPLQNSMESIFMSRKSNNELFSQRKGNVKDSVFSSNYYEDFKKFMDKNLKGNQTFLDFSNNPMLYYYCQRSVPSYFCQSLQNTVTDYQQLSQIKSIDTALVPMVIYQNVPRGWGDQTDDVPSSMRQYLLAEFIYKNYEPFTILNNKSIWVTKGLRSKIDTSFIYTQDTSYTLPLEIDYKNAAWLVNNYYDVGQSDYLKPIGNSKAIFHSQYNFYKVDIPDNVRAENSVYAKITFDKDIIDTQIKVHEGREDWSKIGSFTFLTKSGSKSYMLRLTNHYLWHREGCYVLVLEGLPDNVGCNIEFFRDSRLSNERN